MKKLIFLFLLCMIMVACVKKELNFQMNGQVKGYIFDSSNKPVEGAKVTIGNISSLTDSTGYFVIHNLDINGNPKYQVYVEKDNYTPKVQEVEFKSTVNVNNVGSDSVPLNNSVVTVKINLDELIELKGKIKLPDNYLLNPSDLIKIRTTIEINPECNDALTIPVVETTIDKDLNYTIKPVPRYGLFKNAKGELAKILSAIKFSIFINDDVNATFTGKLENLDLTKFAIEKTGNKNQITLSDCSVNSFYTVSGFVYSSQKELTKDVSQRETVKNAIVILKLNDKEVKRTISNSQGKYEFKEIEPNSGYQLNLLSLDSNNDGKFDYIGRSDFEKFNIEKNQSENKNINIWFQNTGTYSISGKLYVGNKESYVVPNATVSLYSANGLLDETSTSDTGTFTFSNISNKEVYIIAYDCDSDGNGYPNFIGYKADHLASSKTKVSFNNTTMVNINDAELFMKVSTLEPNYNFKVVGGNFFSINSYDEVYNKMGLNKESNIEIYFNKEIDQSTIDSLNNKKTDIVTLTKEGTGEKLAIAFEIDTNNRKKMIINPAQSLELSKYKLQINSELNSVNGFKYGVSNEINTKLLNLLQLDVVN